MILCSHSYLSRRYTNPSSAECDKTVNVPLLNVLFSLFPSPCVQLRELLIPFKFGEVFLLGIFEIQGNRCFAGSPSFHYHLL